MGRSDSTRPVRVTWTLHVCPPLYRWPGPASTYYAPWGWFR